MDTKPTPHPPQQDQTGVVAKTVTSISEIGETVWQASLGHTLSRGREDLTSAHATPGNPFISYAFLDALEASGCVGPGGTGWLSQHLKLEDQTGSVMACAPCYVKLHSRGEYVFDHAWAEACQRSGKSYYPKLQVAVPFTPVPGARLLVHPDHDVANTQSLLASALVTLCDRIDASSAHVTFVDKASWNHLGELGFLKRVDQQFHWHNQDYQSFDDFLNRLSSRKRKTIKKERRQARESGLTFVTLSGPDICEAHWDAFFEFYLDTGARKWGDPYLNRAFFAAIGETLSAECVLMLALDGDTAVAGALHLVGEDCLFGRYWGCTRYHPFLHFELCYYQAMDYAIAHGLARVEAGAQGEHKLLRGYMPTPTYSAHWIADPDLRTAVARYLDSERRDVLRSVDLLAGFGPYKADPSSKA